MAPVQQIQLSVAPVHEKNLTWFRFGELDNHVIMTTDTGQWHALYRSDFERLLAGSVGEEDEIYEPLLQKGFIRNGFDVELYSGQLRQAKGFLQAGALQHRVHLSTDTAVLTVEHAKSIIDHIFTCPTSFLTISLIQGPKPLDKGLISFMHQFAEEKNKYEKRSLVFEVHTRLETTDADLVALLLEKNIHIRAHFDGCETVHNAQTEGRGGPSHEHVLAAIQSIHDAAKTKGFTDETHSVFAEVSVGHAAHGRAVDVLTGLKNAGIRCFQVTPILDGPDAIKPDQFGAFVHGLLRAMGSEEETTEDALREVQTAALLERIGDGLVNGTMVMTSPPSNGYNARSYDPVGNVFPSCSAMVLHEQDDPIFLLGNVATHSSEDIANHPTIRTLMVASMIDCLPGFQHLWSAPFIGIDPVAAYCDTGDLFPKMPTSTQHRATQAMVEAVFRYVLASEPNG